MKKTSKTTMISGSSPRVIFFGNERLATGVTTEALTLQGLIQAGYQVVAVVSSFARGTSRSSRELEISEVAAEHQIPLLLPGKLSDLREQLADYHAAVGVLVAYGQIVPESIIELFPHGIINIHPSLLPKHRGPTPIESTILQGDTKTGVSLMQLAKAMDAGPVFAQTEIPLRGDETKQWLANHLLELGCSMLLELLPDILAGKVVALPQDEARATYDKRIAKEVGVVDWNKSATELEREIRAFDGWPKSRTELGSKEVIITQAHAVSAQGKAGLVEAEDKQLLVYCGRGALAIDQLKPAGKQEMTSEAFLAGHRDLLAKR